MSEEHQLLSDSDEDDEDYVLDDANSDLASEIGSEDDVESSSEDENDENKKETRQRKGIKRHSQTNKNKVKHQKILENKLKILEEESKEEQYKEKKKLNEEEERKKADSLWADFMKDTAVMSKPKPQNTMKTKERSPPIQKPKVQEKVKITKIFEYAGEEVKVEKEVPVDSTEAKLSVSVTKNSTKSVPPAGQEKGGIRRIGLGGISSVLGQMTKKAKISTLEKSKLDWDNYKKQENIEEELNNHNKGKDGYLERQDFLQRADLRQFEIEKQLRNSNRRSTR